MAIENILFDADGVLQYPTVRWKPALKSVLELEDETQVEAVLNDILEAETEVLESPTGFMERLEAKFTNRNRSALVSATLNALHAIEVLASAPADRLWCVRRTLRTAIQTRNPSSWAWENEVR